MMEIKNITIIGAGNVGVSCAVDISNIHKYQVTLLTSKASDLPNELKKIDSDTQITTTSANLIITDDYNKGLLDCDLCIITLPAFLISTLMDKISNFNPKIILFIPGYGDKHKYCEKLLKKGCIITGFDRSPYICRLTNSYTTQASKKTQIRVGVVNNVFIDKIVSLYQEIFNFIVLPLPNYLTVTFTPSNPILHTARLYSMFKNAQYNTVFPRMIKFYSEWTDFASEIMLKMDNELQNLCKVIEKKENIDLSQVIPLTIHYESPTIEQMTNKIKSIKSFKDINSPMMKFENQYKIDWESRYFTEDFPYGLAILKDYAKQYQVMVPTMDLVLDWYYKCTKR